MASSQIVTLPVVQKILLANLSKLLYSCISHFLTNFNNGLVNKTPFENKIWFIYCWCLRFYFTFNIHAITCKNMYRFLMQ